MFLRTSSGIFSMKILIVLCRRFCVIDFVSYLKLFFSMAFTVEDLLAITKTDKIHICAIHREGRNYEIGYAKSKTSAFYSLDVYFAMPDDFVCPPSCSLANFDRVGVDMKVLSDAIVKCLPTFLQNVSPFVIFDHW
jgi:hypothetical protein